MSKNKKSLARKRRQRNLLVLTMVTILAFGGMIGGTLAWLIDDTTPVTNKFTDSNIGIELDETERVYQMVPGWTLDKDPVVTVDADSEDCWLFVKVDESTNLNLSDYIAYEVGCNTTTGTATIGEKTVVTNGWTKGVPTGENANGVPENVYFRKVAKNATNKSFAILAGGTYTDPTDSEVYSWSDNQVLVLPGVTQDMMDDITLTTGTDAGNEPTLTFTAYAVQLYRSNNADDTATDANENEFTPAQAWAKAVANENASAGSGTGTN